MANIKHNFRQDGISENRRGGGASPGGKPACGKYIGRTGESDCARGYDKATEYNSRIPTFFGFPNPYGSPFPASICTSVNHQVVHGIPNDNPLQEGDIVSIDCGTQLNGYCGDSCYTFAVGEISEEVKQLLTTTKEALYKGIEQAVVGHRLGDISYAVQTHCEAQGYGVVREFVGHGIGKKMHEDPQVPNYGRRGNGMLLKNGLCIAIEPMIAMGAKDIYMQEDRWGIVTRDKKPAAHFEHSICVRKGKADILSSFEEIEKVLRDKSL